MPNELSKVEDVSEGVGAAGAAGTAESAAQTARTVATRRITLCVSGLRRLQSIAQLLCADRCTHTTESGFPRPSPLSTILPSRERGATVHGWHRCRLSR